MGQQFVVELLFRGRADTAKAATAEVKREISGVTAATRQATEATARQTAVLNANSQATRLAAGSVGNLTAQFNDIGMMMMAGQNPLQLAIQQGSQISQVLGPMGARGAVAALSAGFLGMLNPVSLVTMGVIAAGAAFTQWLTSADEEALTLEDAIDDLSEATDNYEAALDRALTPMSKLREEFGEQAETVRKLRQAMLAIEEIKYLKGLGTAKEQIQSSLSDVRAAVDEIRDMREQAATDVIGLGLDAAQMQLERSVEDLNAEFGMTVEQAEAIVNAMDQLDAAKGPAEIAARSADLVLALNAAASSSGDVSDGMLAAGEASATLSEKAAHMAEMLGISVDEAETLASVDMAAGISGAAAEALVLANRLGIALSTALSIRNMQGALDYSGAGRGGDPRRFMTPDAGPKPLSSDAQALIDAANKRSSGGGGGASKAMNTDLREAERLFEATRTAAEKYDAELARINELYESGHISAETQARAIEMIGEKYLEAGSDAKFFKEITDDIKDAILDLAVEGSASFDQIAAAIARAAWQATLFGEGPLAGLFGTSGGGGLLSGIFGMFGAAPAHADGGLITGPGTGRSDSILARVSNGEYIVNAEATARHRGLLEAINGGAGLPGFATGGLVGALPAPILVGSQSQGTEAPLVRIALSLTDDLDARIDQRSARVAVDVTGESLRQFTRKGLPGEVQKIVGDRRVRN